MAARLVTTWTLAVSGLLAVTPKALAIGHWYSTDPNINDRYYTSPDYDGSIPPAGLDAPTDYLLSRNGAFVAPLWIMGAHHQSGGVGQGDMVSVHIPKSLLLSGGDGYEVVQIEVDYGISPDDAAENTPLDIRLIKLEDEVIPNSGGLTLSQINQNYFKLSPSLLPGSHVTFGGFGKIFIGNPDGGQASDKGLHWGQNVVSVVYSPTQGGNLGLKVDQLGMGDYRKYEGAPLAGDSGSGIFFRDGWEWAIGGTLVAGVTGFEIPSETANGLDLRSNYEWVLETLDTDLPAYTTPALPQPDTIWEGYSHDWSATNLWSDGLPDETSIVKVRSPINISSTTGVAEAQDVFLLTEGGFNGNVSQSGGELEVTNFLYLGPEDGDSIAYNLSGGEVTARRVYVGFNGSGLMQQSGGTLTAHEAVYVGKGTSEQSGYSSYAMGNGSLSTTYLIIGLEAGSDGEFHVTGFNSPSVSVDVALQVGVHGEGLMTQSVGTVTAGSLSLGVSPGSSGTYLFGGGQLVSLDGILRIGVEGTGVFVQNGDTLSFDQITVNPASTLELAGGTLGAVLVNIEGTLIQKDGILDSSALEAFTVAESATIDFADSEETLHLARIADLSAASIINSFHATIDIDSESLLIVNPATANSITAGDLFITRNGQPIALSDPAIHVAGDTVSIDGNTARGTGTIHDFVTVSDTGELEASAGPIHLMKGLVKSDDAYVDLGDEGLLTVTGLEESLIQSTNSTARFNAAGIHVEEQGQLTIGGTVILTGDPGNSQFLQNRGHLEIGDDLSEGSIASLDLLKNDSGLDRGLFLSIGGNSTVVFDLTQAEHDEIMAYGVFLSDSVTSESGAIELNVPVEEVGEDRLPQLDLGDAFTLITVDSEFSIANTDRFGRVEYGGGNFASWEDIYANGMALAVVYKGDEFVANDGECDGICVHVALPGDFNLDGVVNFSDIYLMSPNFDVPGVFTWVDGDVTGDGVVNFDDMYALSPFFTESSNLTAVPDPSTLALTSLALLGLLYYARRK